MNIRLGIYEFFARIIPGAFYMAGLAQFLVVIGLLKVDWQMLNNISLVVSVGLIVICYVLGEAFDRFALAWFRVFKKPGFSELTFTAFKKRYQDRWELNFKGSDWPILLAFIRTKNMELAGEIERHNALSIMLRNVSVGLLIMVVNTLIQFIIVRSIINVIVAAILLLISVLIIIESTKFRTWFYNGILETMLAYRIDLEAAIKPVPEKLVQRRSKKQV